MECTKCKIQMEEGQISRSSFWLKKTDETRQGMLLSKLVGSKDEENDGVESLIAYRCPNCKRVELYTNP